MEQQDFISNSGVRISKNINGTQFATRLLQIQPIASLKWNNIQTSLAKCGNKSSPSNQKLSPQNCKCAYPYEGTLYFRTLSFQEFLNASLFHALEMSLWTQLSLTLDSVLLPNPFNSDDYLEIQLQLFPSTGKYFNDSEVQMLRFTMISQTYKTPSEFRPYYFEASAYKTIPLS